MLSLRNLKVGVVGLGYVGLPLAVEFGRHFRTVGFDIKSGRIKELRAGKDSTLEVSPKELRQSAHLILSTVPAGGSFNQDPLMLFGIPVVFRIHHLFCSLVKRKCHRYCCH